MQLLGGAGLGAGTMASSALLLLQARRAALHALG